MTQTEYEKFMQQQKEWQYYDNFEKYLKEHTEETGDYLPLQSHEANTMERVYLDSCRSFLFNHHPMWVYAECKISKNIDVIPISISRSPQVLCNIQFNNRQNKIIESAKRFIINNTPLLMEYARGNIDIINFFKTLNNKRQILSEGLLCEMPVLQSNVTGLPTDIWVDNNRGKQHTNRIKFNDKGNGYTREWASMTIDSNNPIVKNLSDKTTLSNFDIEKIKNFVRYNYDILNRLASDPTMNYEKEFIPYIFKMKGEKGYDIPAKRVEQLEENIVDVECFIRDNRLYFLTGNERFSSLNFINLALQHNIFKKQDNYTVYIELDNDRHKAYQQSINALNELKLIAKFHKIEMKIYNTECIYNLLM